MAPKRTLLSDVDGMKWRESIANQWQHNGRGLWTSLFNPSDSAREGTVIKKVLSLDRMAEFDQQHDEPALFTKVTVYSLLACVAQFAVGFAFAQKWGHKCSAVDRWVLVWLFYDAIVHFTLVGTQVHARNVVYLTVTYLFTLTVQEGPFVYMSLVGNVASSDNLLAELCEYSDTTLQY